MRLRHIVFVAFLIAWIASTAIHDHSPHAASDRDARGGMAMIMVALFFGAFASGWYCLLEREPK